MASVEETNNLQNDILNSGFEILKTQATLLRLVRIGEKHLETQSNEKNNNLLAADTGEDAYAEEDAEHADADAAYAVEHAAEDEKANKTPVNIRGRVYHVVTINIPIIDNLDLEKLVYLLLQENNK